MKKLRTCVMGATGIVGQQFIEILVNHPYFELVGLTASTKSAGKRYSEATEWSIGRNVPKSVANEVVIENTLEKMLKKDLDLVFSALPSNVAGEIESSLAKEGIYVFSNASAHRMDSKVPILIPEVNPNHLNIVTSQDFNGGFIVTNSNCSAAGLVIGLKPLMKFGIRSTIVTTYQALSGAGRRGVASMDILGNIIPYIKGEEGKIEQETRKMLGKFEDNQIKFADFYINASCARVPTKNGHLESVVVKFEKNITIEAALKAFDDFTGEPQLMELPTAPKKPIILSEEPSRPQPARDLYSPDPNEVPGMAVTVGRVRKKGNRLNFFLLVHNAIRGAAGASILNAEFAYAKNFFKNL
ncbi:MAG: aspartate-semialdehyde dehydrogenase [Candidatus Hermodarchaeota archaeon]